MFRVESINEGKTKLYKLYWNDEELGKARDNFDDISMPRDKVKKLTLQNIKILIQNIIDNIED